jgi:hypothetical protein
LGGGDIGQGIERFGDAERIAKPADGEGFAVQRFGRVQIAFAQGRWPSVTSGRVRPSALLD